MVPLQMEWLSTAGQRSWLVLRHQLTLLTLVPCEKGVACPPKVVEVEPANDVVGAAPNGVLPKGVPTD